MKQYITDEKVFRFTRSLFGAQTDQPFEGDFTTTVLRHSDTGKWFGIVLDAPKNKVGVSGEGTVRVLNLKCDPLFADILFQAYRGIVPAYHMNKRHWISVVLAGDVPWEEVENCIRMSYALTAKKQKKKTEENPNKEARKAIATR